MDPSLSVCYHGVEGKEPFVLLLGVDFGRRIVGNQLQVLICVCDIPRFF